MDIMDVSKKFVGSCVNGVVDIYAKTVGKGTSAVTKTMEQELAKQAKISADSAINEMQRMVRVGHPLVRLAGLSGAAAVILGAYGAHGFAKKKDISDEFKQVFETANKYHFLHSIAMLGVPLTRKPLLTGSLLALGTVIFSGTCYYYALTQETWIRKYTPYGGFLLIFGWLSMIL